KHNFNTTITRPLRRGFVYLCSAEGKKAGRQVQFAPSASLCSTIFTAEMGARSLSALPSPLQRYNTLDFASKVVCHETPARFLWILPAQKAPSRCLPVGS